MKLVFLKDKYNNLIFFKKLGFKVRYHYAGYSFNEKDFDKSKISHLKAKVGVSYHWNDDKADDNRGSYSRVFQYIVIYGDNCIFKKGYVELQHHSGSVSAILPKFVDMVGKQYFEVRDVDGERN